MEVEFPNLKTEDFYDTARGFNHVTKGLKDLVEGGIITAQEAKEMALEANLGKRIKMIS